MASGDTLFTLTATGPSVSPPASDYATFDTIADGSTPAMNIPVLDFDGASDEHMDWFVVIPSQYGETTGFTFSYIYAMASTDGDQVEMEFRALHIDDQVVVSGDLGIDTQTPVTITDDPDATANDLNYSTTGALAKASFGSAAPGDLLCIRATRDEDGVAENVDDLQLVAIIIKET